MRICQEVKHVQYLAVFTFNLLNPTIVFKCICVMLDYSDCKRPKFHPSPSWCRT